MDPQAYLALSPEEQNAYLKSLAADQRLTFVSSVDAYEQAQISAEEGGPNARQLASPPLARLPLAQINPLTPSIPSEREDPAEVAAEEIAEIEPSKRTVDQKDEWLRGNVSKIKDRMTSLASVTASFTDMANLANPESSSPGVSAVAGGISGLVSGGPLGAVLGAVTGALKAGTQREGYEQQEALKKRRALTGLRAAPTIQETGGIVDVEADPETDIEIPIQAEEGEVMLLPDGKLVDSMANKSHKEMAKEGKNQVTDVIPSGTMVFSNSKKRLINLKDIKDDVFVITRGTYSEDENVPGETITMGDVLGDKGKVTPAFLVKKIRRMLPIIETPNEQYEVETNKENMGRRAQLLRLVMEMQEGVYKKFEYEKPEQFETGGMVAKKTKKRAIPIYETGGVVDPKSFVTMSKAERDAYLASLPTYEERAKFMQGVYDLGVANFSEKPPVSEQSVVTGDVQEAPKAPTGVVDAKSFVAMPKAERDAHIASLPNYEERAKFMQGVYDIGVANFSEMGANAPGDTPKGPPKTASIVGDDLVTDDTVQNTDPQIVVPGATGPFADPGATTTNPDAVVVDPKIKSPRIGDDALDRSDQIFEGQRKQTDEAYANSLADSQSLYRSQRFRNFSILASKLGGIGVQNPNVTPEYKGTEHVDSMFPQVTESQVQGQINPIRQGQSRVLSAINDSGISATKIGSAIASTQDKLIDAESEIRDKALGVNQSQKAKRHERLQAIIDFNTNAEVTAENNTRSNRNALVAQIGGTSADAIKAGGELKTAWSERKQELDRWRAENKNTITQSEYDGVLKKEQLRIEREWNDKIKTGIEKLLKETFKTV